MTDPFSEMLDLILGGVGLLVKSLLQSLLEPIIIPVFILLDLFS